MLSAEVLCSAGPHSEKELTELRVWLDADQRRWLIYFTPEAAELFPWFGHPRVCLCALPCTEDAVRQLAVEFAFSSITYSSQNGQILTFFAQVHEEMRLRAFDSADLGERLWRNTCTNLPFLARAKAVEGLKGKFRGLPALICGSGPSLQEHIEELRGCTERALIFAAGSSSVSLAAAEIAPHFQADVDPHIAQERLDKQTCLETPLLFQTRVTPAVLQRARGALLWAPASGNHPLEQWVQEELGIDAPPLDGGWNAATFCAALALQMGCNPIILVGVDLSAAAPMEGMGGMPNGRGQTVFVRRDWILAAHWFEQLVQRHSSIRWLRAPNRGLILRGVTELPFAGELDKKYNTYELVGSAVLHLPTLPALQIADCLKKLEKSVARCSALCGELLGCAAKIYPKSLAESGQIALLECELAEEVVYTKFLVPLWQLWQYPLLRASHPHPKLQQWLFFQRVLNGTQ